MRPIHSEKEGDSGARNGVGCMLEDEKRERDSHIINSFLSPLLRTYNLILRLHRILFQNFFLWFCGESFQFIISKFLLRPIIHPCPPIHTPSILLLLKPLQRDFPSSGKCAKRQERTYFGKITRRGEGLKGKEIS
jgi:hypothetical protein